MRQMIEEKGKGLVWAAFELPALIVCALSGRVSLSV